MPSRVIVVGAGPAGASLAYLLARAGIRTTLLERQTDFAREFRGEALMPSGLDAIRQMGLGPQLEALPQAVPEQVEIYQAGHRVLTLGLASLGGVGGGPHFVSQPALLEMLVAQAEKLPDFRLERGFTARDLLREGDRVAGVRGDSRSGPTDLPASLVIGADGRASVVRKRSALDRPRDPQAFDLVWCRVPRNPRGGDAIRFYLGPGHFCIAFPTHDGRLQIGWVIEKGAFGALRRRGIDEWMNELADHVSPDLGDHLRAHGDDVTDPFLLDVLCDHLLEWSAPGLLLLGDAAHPMSPVAAQGLNIALRDSLVAANHLTPVLVRGGSSLEVETACRRVRDERLPEVQTIQQMQRMAPRVLFQRSPWSRLLVGRIAPVLARLGVLERLAGAGARRFTLGTTQVELRV
jgi:2-polyprenyl-6-methoxyphenol hydroxylase-like FAD-dependent oxidoreductase